MENPPISAYLGLLEIDLGELPADTFDAMAAYYSTRGLPFTPAQMTRRFLRDMIEGAARDYVLECVHKGRIALLARQKLADGEIEAGRADPAF